MMDKAIVIADIHIDDFRYFNPTDEDYDKQDLIGEKVDYRLNQCITLAKGLVSYAKSIGCKYLFILGDIIHKPRPIPKVITKVCEFFEILNNYFKVYYILGNHDVDAGSNEIAVENSTIPVIAKSFSNIHYMDGKVLNLESSNGKTYSFAFKDYQYNTSTIDYMDCDVALGHVTLSFGQEPKGNYKLGLFGDIHEPIDIDRDHSIGTPYQLFPSQPELGKIGIIDYSDGIKFNRVDSDYMLSTYMEVR